MPGKRTDTWSVGATKIDREHYLPALTVFSHFIMFSRKNPATSKQLS